MTTAYPRLLAPVVAIALLASPFADAARLGGGKSRGMSRSYNTAPARPAAQSAPQPMPQPMAQPVPQAPQRSGPGWGGVAAGAAAGAAAGYMLGQSGNHSAVPQTMSGTSGAAAIAPTATSSGMPWGTILLLGGLTVVGFLLFRRMNGRPAVAAASSSGYAPATPGGSKVYRIGGDAQPYAGNTGSSAPLPIIGGRLADGTEVAAFLRQAKASFMHLQTMNSPENIDELRKYLTPALFDALREDVAANTETAEFPLLDAEVIESVRDGDQFVASVRFSGRVSESLNSPEVPFEEYWHFIKPVEGSAVKWLVAGIQQG